jgi:ribitol-5-phosphate 2-dehydrogenase (NADP+) / D-ribitol-5-phosphate cytidylyltransferase
MAASPARRRTVGVILAGGVGSRVGSGVPKQLVEVAGRPVIEHTIAAFEATPAIDEIVVLMAAGHLEAVTEIVAAAGFRKVAAVLPGGTRRSDTTRLALDWLGDADVDVLLHDGARPLVSERILADCVVALGRYEAVAVVVDATDTVVGVDGDVIADIPDRRRLRRCQTPQGFRLSTIRRAYELAAQDPAFVATDDAGVVLRYLPEIPVHVIEGAEDNIKVTTPLDLLIVDALARRPGR